MGRFQLIGLWDFFARSSWPRTAHARAQLTWLLRQAPDPQPGMLFRLRSADEREALAAHSELYVLALLVAAGHNCRLGTPTLWLPPGQPTPLRQGPWTEARLAHDGQDVAATPPATATRRRRRRRRLGRPRHQ